MAIVLLLIGILLVVIGLVNTNLLLLIIGGITCLASGFKALQIWQSKKANARRIKELTEGMDRYFATQTSLQLSEHVSIQRPNKDYHNFLDLVVYYDGQYVSSLQSFATTPSFESTYAFIEEKLTGYCFNSDFVDENRNGIDDRKEDKRAPYYCQILEQESHRFAQPEIQASLKSISSRLGQIHELEIRYDGVSTRLRKLYQHYLPMMTSILDQYHTLEAKGASTDELIQMEMKLSKTLILVEEALKTIIASLVQDDVLNIKSDMSVLEAILKRDGLVKEGTLESVGGGHD